MRCEDWSRPLSRITSSYLSLDPSFRSYDFRLPSPIVIVIVPTGHVTPLHSIGGNGSRRVWNEERRIISARPSIRSSPKMWMYCSRIFIWLWLMRFHLRRWWKIKRSIVTLAVLLPQCWWWLLFLLSVVADYCCWWSSPRLTFLCWNIAIPHVPSLDGVLTSHCINSQ